MSQSFIVDQESVVYGRIKSASLLSVKDLKKQIYTNKKAILLLSDSNSEGVLFESTSADSNVCGQSLLLTQDMFTVSPMQMNGEYTSVNIIHFAMSYYGVEYEWSEWMSRFESLLKSMYWQSAVVHLETELSGLHTFKWESVNASHIPGKNDFNVRCEWDHEINFTE
jgi:hypothetical protein